jgi:hypothetical protein
MVPVNVPISDGIRLKVFVQAVGCRQIRAMDCTTRCGDATATSYLLTPQSSLLQWRSKSRPTQIDNIIDFLHLLA